MVLKVYLEILVIALISIFEFFDNFILADELFTKALQSPKTFVSVNNNFRGKLVLLLELPVTFDERFIANSVPFFIPDFNLLSCELNNFTFNRLY